MKKKPKHSMEKAFWLKNLFLIACLLFTATPGFSQNKPWDTNGIDGVHRFLKKLWNLFYQGDNWIVTDQEPTKEELKSLHKLIKKISWDVENFSYNTSISAFMICVNELTSLKSHNKQILEKVIILLAPFAPHISEELWHELGYDSTVCDARWPEWKEEYLKEDVVTYAISFNGKARYNLEIPASCIPCFVNRKVRIPIPESGSSIPEFPSEPSWSNRNRT
jgi:leucyl-tRNA synthetase